MSDFCRSAVNYLPFVLACCSGLWLATPGDLLAQTNYQRIHTFGPTLTQGSSPRGQLIEDASGTFYGITYQGGTNGLGSIFKVERDGAHFVTLRSLGSGIIFPVSGVVEGSDGALYGTVPNGGTASGGVVYKINKDGSGWTVLRSFNRAPADGDAPLSELLKASNDYLYGTTAGGGISNLGTLFRINNNGTDYSLLFDFRGTNGALPSAALIEGHDGWLYGTTKKGGGSDAGTVFRIQKDGANHTVLRSFLGSSQSDGAEPLGTLAQGSDGFLYGTTYVGGTPSQLGTVFKLNTNGTGYQVIYYGQNNVGSGWSPVAGVTWGPGGNLYGTFTRGGASDSGIVFRLKPDGTGFTILHSFSLTGGDGNQPFAPLTISGDGALYGSTFFGGDYVQATAYGVLFRVFDAEPQVKITRLAPDNGQAKVEFAGGAAGRLYSVQRSTNLLSGGWDTLGSVTARIDGTFDYHDPAGFSGSAGFYRSVKP